MDAILYVLGGGLVAFLAFVGLLWYLTSAMAPRRNDATQRKITGDR